MAKKRRKLNKDFERKIYSSKKNVELVLAKIYDIDDEDIQNEYMVAFNGVVYLYDELKESYERQGFNDKTYSLTDYQIKKICKKERVESICIKNLKEKRSNLQKGDIIEIPVKPYRK